MKPSATQKTILFVDDEVMMTKWFERTFKPEFHVVSANSVTDALFILQANIYDIAVVVTDFRMPERDGLDLLRSVAANYPSIVKILASAYADKDLVIQAVNQQLVFRVIEKPWADDVVRNVLTDALRQHDQYVAERKKLNDSMSGMRESLGFLAHELNAPLSTISSYLGMLQDEHVSLAASQQTMAAAQRSIEFCLSLVRSISRSSRQAFGKPQPETLSASRLVQLLLSELPLSNLDRQLITWQQGADFLITAKQNLIYLCLSSIINNALRELALKPDHPNPRIHIDMGISSGSTEQHWIRVSDNAGGIPSAVLAQLLQKPVTLHEHQGGTGMGLLFCQKVMTSLGGDIRLETRHASQGYSQKDTGTSVFLLFPTTDSTVLTTDLESSLT